MAAYLKTNTRTPAPESEIEFEPETTTADTAEPTPIELPIRVESIISDLTSAVSNLDNLSL